MSTAEYSREFRLDTLPTGYDLTSYTHKSWFEGQTFTTSNRTTRLGMTYVCISAHTADAAKKPESGASWETYWARVLEKNSHYYIEVDSSNVDYYVTDNADPPNARLVSEGPAGQISSDNSITDMKAMTQLTYDALVTKSATTIYFIHS
jgi:hypothetical protein